MLSLARRAALRYMSTKIEPLFYPVGVSTFAAIRKTNRFNVDKTAMLRPIFRSIPDHVLFARPPRFGKSQLLSTLEAFSDLRTSEDEFNELFGGLAVMQDKQIVDTYARKYAVLPLTMPNVSPLSDSFVDDIHHKVNQDLQRFARKYELPIVISQNCSHTLDDILQNASNLTTLITIDEYDRIARRVALHDDDKATLARDVLSNILGAIKDNSGKCRLFMTGVTPLASREISGPANFIRDVSFDPDLATVCGLPPANVKAEVARIVSQRPELKDDPLAAEDLFVFMQDYFNGYRFVKSEQTTLFNPQQCLVFFQFLVKSSTPIGNVLEAIRNARRDGTYLLRGTNPVSDGIDVNSQISSLAYDILPLNRKEILDVAQDLTGEKGYLQTSSMDGLTYKQLRSLGDNATDTIATYLFHQGAATFSSIPDRLIAPNRIEKNLTLDKIRGHVVSTSLIPLLFQDTISDPKEWCSTLEEAFRRVYAANEHKGAFFVEKEADVRAIVAFSLASGTPLTKVQHEVPLPDHKRGDVHLYRTDKKGLHVIIEFKYFAVDHFAVLDGAYDEKFRSSVSDKKGTLHIIHWKSEQKKEAGTALTALCGNFDNVKVNYNKKGVKSTSEWRATWKKEAEARVADYRAAYGSDKALRVMSVAVFPTGHTRVDLVADVPAAPKAKKAPKEAPEEAP